MDTLTLVLLCGALLVGAILLFSTAFFVLPMHIEAGAQMSAEHTLSTHIVARACLGALVLRRREHGRFELVCLGLVVWRARQRGRWLKRLRSELDTGKRRAQWQRKFRRMVSVMRAAAPRWWFFVKLMKRAFAASKVRISVGGTIGFDDPADTVVFFEILRLISRCVPRLRLMLDRDYFDEVLELDVEARAQIWPPKLMGLGLWALTQRELWPVLRAAWRPVRS